LRETFRGVLKAVQKLAKGRLERAVKRTVLRPPGAVEEVLFLALCDHCGKCAEACPYNVISLSDESAALAAGTPEIHPEYGPCRFCDGFPCAAACRTGALEPAHASTTPMGVVALDTTRCFAWHGSECDECVKACPRGGKALVLREGRVYVDRRECVGCGMCQHVCPAAPSAIEVHPLTETDV